MTVASEITRIKDKVTDCYDVCRTAGVEVPTGYQPIANLATTIAEVNKPIFGIGINNILGEKQGTQLTKQVGFNWVATGLKKINDGALTNYLSTYPKMIVNSISWPDLVTINSSGCLDMCKSNTTVQTFSAPKLKAVGPYGCKEMFYAASGLITADLSGLTTVDSLEAFRYAFYNASNLTSANVSSLTTVSGENGCYGMFRGTAVALTSLPNLTSVSGQYGMAFFLSENLAITQFTFTKLQSVTGVGGLGQFFTRSTNLKKIYFPALTTVVPTAFGDALGNGMCNGCTGVTEIHFKASVKSQVEATITYSEKFGATNATIYFDL